MRQKVWVQSDGNPLRLLVPKAAASTVKAALDALPLGADGLTLTTILADDVDSETLETIEAQLQPSTGGVVHLAQHALDGTARIALTFAGQAQTYIETIKAVYTSSPSGREIIEICSAAMVDELSQGVDLFGLHPYGVDVVSWLADPELAPEASALGESALSQPLIFVAQVAQLTALRDLGLASEHIERWCTVTTGHSQGVFTAALAAEGHDFKGLAERSARIVRYLLWQGVHMQAAWGRSGVSGSPMLAITGRTAEEIRPVADAVEAEITLLNGPGRLVLSGTPESLDSIIARLEAEAIANDKAYAAGQAVRLPRLTLERLGVSAPFHSRWMRDAVAPLQAQAIRLDAVFSPDRLKVPVLRYEDGQIWDGIPDLIESMCLNPVNWQATVTAMVADYQPTHVLDLGPGGGVAALVAINAAGAGIRVIGVDTSAGKRALAGDLEDIAQPRPWASWAPRAIEGNDGVVRLHNAYTELTGRPPILLPGMTPTTVDASIIAAAANAGYLAELAGGGQPTEAILRRRADELRDMLAPGEGYVFNALYLDPYLWGLQLGRDRLVQQLRAEGHPILGVTVSAGLPPVAEAVALLDEWRMLGMVLNSFKAGTDDQVRQILAIADATEVPFILQLEGGRAGGHHGFDELDTLLKTWYGRIRRRPHVVLAVGGGIGDPKRAQALLMGTWCDGQVRPVDAIFVGTAVMAAKEATTAPGVKAALVNAPGATTFVTRGEVAGGVRSGRSGLGADIHYLDNHAARVESMLDGVAGHAAAAEARRDEIIAALAKTAKPYFGDLTGMCYHGLLDRMATLMAMGQGGAYEDGIWLDRSHRSRFGDMLRRGLQRCGYTGDLPDDLELDHPVERLDEFAAECTALCAIPVFPEDQRYFMAVCERPGKPVPFVPVIDANVHRWYTRDSLWQAHDARFDAEAVLVLPGPAGISGITKANEPIADLLGRFLASTIEALPAESKRSVDAVQIALSAERWIYTRRDGRNRLADVVAAGGELKATEEHLVLTCDHVRPDGTVERLTLGFEVRPDHPAPLRIQDDVSHRLRAFYRRLMSEPVTLDAPRVATYRRVTRDDGASLPIQLFFATALPAMLGEVLAEKLAIDPLSLLHLESDVRRLRDPEGETSVQIGDVRVVDGRAGRRIEVTATVNDTQGLVARLFQVFLVRRVDDDAILHAGDPGRGPERETGVRLERARPDITATLHAPIDLGPFAQASGDLNPIHRDSALAALAGLGGPIVHGQWTVAAAGARLGGVLREVQARFLAPVQPGETLKMTAQVVARLDGDDLLEVQVSGAYGPVLTMTARREAPRTALIFPGQGCQRAGMGMAAYQRSAAARKVWDEADQHTRDQHGFSLLSVVRDNPVVLDVGQTVVRHPKGVIHVTQFTQVALTVLAVAGVAELREAGACPPKVLFCGHSVGEYSALAAVANILPLGALIDVVYQRGLTMQNFVDRDAEGRSSYGMGVIRPYKAGLNEADAFALVEQVAKAAGAPLYIVNHNIRGRQYAVAGDVAALTHLRNALPEAAWIDLPGIDVPFHSPLIANGVGAFKEVLESCIAKDLDIRGLVGDYVPNLVAQPFALTPEFVHEIEAVIGQDLSELAADPEVHGRAILIELLAWQFASPVRWIETQDVLRGVTRIIEIGPGGAPVLVNMLGQTIASQTGRVPAEIWQLEASRDAVFGVGPEPIVEVAEEVMADPEVGTVTAPMTAAAPTALADEPLSVEAALRAMLALALGQPLAALDGDRSIDDLLGGNSARRNQVLLDVGQEFGVGPVDGAHELPLPALAEALQKASPRYTHPGPYLRAAQDAGLTQLGAVRKDAEAKLGHRWGLASGRQQAVLTVVAVESLPLAEAVQLYAQRANVTISDAPVRATTTTVVQTSGEPQAIAEARWRALARAALQAGGLDPSLLEGAALVPEMPRPKGKTDGPRFDAGRHVALTAATQWARADLLAERQEFEAGETDGVAIARAASPSLLLLIDELASGAAPKVAARYAKLRAAAVANLAGELPWANETALITGAGPGSIAEAVIAELLSGGARVIVTTSRQTRARVARYKSLYRTNAGRGASLHIVPLDQGNFEDIDALCGWLYGSEFMQRGAKRVQLKSPWAPTLCFPFGAVPAEGDPTTLDADIVRTLQVNLVGVQRLIGALAREAMVRGPETPPVHVVLPLSPNHGQMGRDGLYAEAKAGLEAMLKRWHSEYDRWGRAVSLCGARIGWVRGTGLMSGLDRVYQHVESALGIQTYTPEEMASALLNYCTEAARVKARVEPIEADLSGGFGAAEGLRELISEALASAAARPESTEQVTPRLPCALYDFPRLPEATNGRRMDPADAVVIVGYGELGPYGSSRIRWSMERDGALSEEACLELAWLCGCVVFEGADWVDAESGEPIDVTTVFETYSLGERVGMRPIEGFDPLTEVLYDEIVLTEDLRFRVATEDRARAFQTLDPNHTDVVPQADGDFMVLRRAGSRIRVPRAEPIDRGVGAEIPTGFDPVRLGIDPAWVDGVDPVAVMNLLATTDAFRCAGLTPESLWSAVHPARIASSQGSGIGGMRSLTRLYTESRLDTRRQTDVLQETLINVTAAWPAMALYGGYGPMVHPVAACATAAVSVELGIGLLRQDKADFVVAGAFDDLSPEGSRGFGDMNATMDETQRKAKGLDPDQASRPCDARRGGFIEAQGGGTLLLCRGDLAIKLGLPIYGVLAGAWSRGDGIQRSVPAPGPGLLSIAAGGDASPLARSLSALGLTADDISFISMHGTSTDANDTNETALHANLAKALGRRPGNALPVVAQKGLTGHSKGGAAAWQIIGAMQALVDGVIPPMRNLDEPDARLAERWPLVYPDRPIHTKLQAALLTSLGFGHVGAAVCVAHPDVLLTAIEPGDLASYARRRADRWRARFAEEHAVRIGDAPFFKARTKKPDFAQSEAAFLLDPDARC